MTSGWVRSIFPPTQLREKSCCCNPAVFLCVVRWKCPPSASTTRESAASSARQRDRRQRQDTDMVRASRSCVALLRGTARAHSRVLHQPCTVRACPARRACKTKTTWRSSTASITLPGTTATLCVWPHPLYNVAHLHLRRAIPPRPRAVLQRGREGVGSLRRLLWPLCRRPLAVRSDSCSSER